ncbi:polyphosphate kinase 2 family protein [Aureimonas leprariae]|uniref:Polyphosphate kinase n=1 Tax=Plantimonas leprariae TaxID=2615207 RepID=A0A7V7PRU2_9HYPH|nr:polyphosphate kinase [Aureimonas leprariae]KAB0681481.1 polyphosphate kinase [Aureimonas leprariae]
MTKHDKPERFSFADQDFDRKLPKDEDYDERLADLQRTLVAIEQAYLGSEHSAAIVFEGWDAAGKGGTIRRISAVLDPRGFKVWPIAAPTPEELKRHYLSRFWQRLPGKGEIAVFDRSWYGRVLVERVEGYAEKPAWKRAFGEIVEFEKTLVDSGTRVVKIFLAIDREEQLKRFAKRMDDPLKRWKLSADDFRNRDKWDLYIDAAEEMIAKTSTENAPWRVVASNHKKYSRVTAIQHIVDHLSAGIDLTPRPLPDAVREVAEKVIAEEGIEV